MRVNKDPVSHVANRLPLLALRAPSPASKPKAGSPSLGNFLLVFLATVTCAAEAREGSVPSNFYLENATSLEAGCDASDYRELQLACHRVLPGDGVVVGVRLHKNRWVANDQFTKLTIVLPQDMASGRRYELNTSGAGAFYSTGLSASPGKTGCYGRAISGSVLVSRKSKNRLDVELEGVFDLRSPTGWKQDCSTREVKQKIHAKQTTISALGPWEGVRKSGDDLLSESYP